MNSSFGPGSNCQRELDQTFLAVAKTAGLRSGSPQSGVGGPDIGVLPGKIASGAGKVIFHGFSFQVLLPT
ncbi:hypothetical protein SAMN05216236_16112 [Sedimentitalea nanhaiensis]|uniref:Uncharacterized protein n=1 Tax=Sedimentitalea nanhaiensis TaxID=999627 RepID=A0A1I7EBU6_9RHOB|nr:hypothetical protein SAMN05216236_16112 [Sedimentitalea nanhaiensis]